MILESHILSLSSPSSHALKGFKKTFSLHGLSLEPALEGRDRHLFDNEQDLVALAPVDTDRLNIFLTSYFGWFFRVSNLYYLIFPDPSQKSTQERVAPSLSF